MQRARPGAAVAAALGLLAFALPVVVLTAPSAAELTDPLTLVLAACAIVSVLFASDWEGAVDISSAFVCFMLAVAFVGPVAAFAIPVAAEVITFAVRRYRPQALPINVAATAIPSLLAALVYGELVGTLRDGRPGDLAELALVAVGFIVLNYATISALVVLLDGGSLRDSLRPPR